MASKLPVPVIRSGEACPIFSIPSAGTTVLSLVRLARSFKSPHPFYAFEFSELPTGGERPVTIAQIASLCIQEIRAVQEAGPYFIGGHCWRGEVAFEIAARLERTGDKVASLTLLESVPPLGNEATADDVPPPARAKAVSDLCERVREKLSRLPPELAERFGPVSWELIDVARRYRATTHISAPVFLIRTPTHPKSVFQDWSHLTSGGFEEHIVPGDAFSILVAPVVKIVGASLDEALRDHRDRARAGQKGVLSEPAN
jgi:thioesterase domain-containing protein